MQTTKQSWPAFSSTTPQLTREGSSRLFVHGHCHTELSLSHTRTHTHARMKHRSQRSIDSAIVLCTRNRRTHFTSTDSRRGSSSRSPYMLIRNISTVCMGAGTYFGHVATCSGEPRDPVAVISWFASSGHARSTRLANTPHHCHRAKIKHARANEKASVCVCTHDQVVFRTGLHTLGLGCYSRTITKHIYILAHTFIDKPVTLTYPWLKGKLCWLYCERI